MTTIGRGGSDTSAAALGAALNAEFIDIFTDVEGIMTADPRIAENARPLSVVTYSEVCNMAYQGAKVIHPRAVEIADASKSTDSYSFYLFYGYWNVDHKYSKRAR